MENEIENLEAEKQELEARLADEEELNIELRTALENVKGELENIISNIKLYL